MRGVLPDISKKKTKEPQYEDILKLEARVGRSSLGLMTNQLWHDDPKHFVFVLARYKFVARMLEGKQSALEIGCGDAFGTRLIQQTVPMVTALDFDPIFIEDAQSRLLDEWPVELKVHDILQGPVEGNFDSAYCIDVLEHIDPDAEGRFVENIAASIDPNGVAIFGMPSIESQVYASKQSKEGHVNCKTGLELREFLAGKFHNVFVFSMNDEVVHTGFYPMAHYLFAVCCGVR
jgi:2-polyprenyl-3-methyl-5-hydroxy-6-metoxy-1,4-benzoquinol methylase